MRRVGIVAALVFALVATAQCAPVQADPFESYNPEFINRCVSGAGADRTALGACLGVGATPCIAAEGSSTMAYMLCWDHEATQWRDVWQSTTRDMNTRLTYRDPQRLAAANTAWEAWAEAECEYWAWEEGGGSGEQVDRARCYARLNAERAATLISALAERP
jgi:uncharacterized protein YecT (DUF1311 family)